MQSSTLSTSLSRLTTALTGALLRQPGVTTILFVYLVYYAVLIIRGHGIPFVIDNTETYSSLNHAYNLYNFDFFRSFGIADEAVSPEPAAHPVVHTHQGNFPRLFSFLLFVLGARSAQSQIIITTFTIGTASVLMAQAYFRRLGGELFATIVVLIMMTDYLMFAQWQVNTYRVWHGFFLFAALLCVHGLPEWKRGRWLSVTFSLYTCLFYWEWLFATFVAATVGFYTIWIYRRNPRLIILAGVVQGIAAALGVAIIFAQVILYLGWDGFLTDLRLTFAARNHASDDQTFLALLREFYDSRNVVFFYNFQSESNYGGLLPFLRSLFRYVFEIPTPFVTLLGLGLAASAFCADSRQPGPRDVAVAARAVSYSATALLIPGFFILLWVIARGDTILGLATTNIATEPVDIIQRASVCFVLALALAFGMRVLAARISLSGTPAGLDRCLRAGLFLLGFGLLIRAQENLYDWGHAVVWLTTLALFDSWAAKIVVLGVATIGVVTILAGRRRVLGAWHNVPLSVAPFLLCGFMGYVLVYKLSGGYLHAGYLLRNCPLPIFHFDALLGFSLTMTVAVALTLAGPLLRQPTWRARLIGCVAATVGLAFVCSWGWVQAQYSYRLPPTKFEFISLLEEPAFRGRGIVSNNYVIPFGLVAQTWAYSFILSPGSAEAMGLLPWALLADRGSNPAYRHPELYVCFDSTNFRAVIFDLIGTVKPSRCSALDIMRRALSTNDDGKLPRVKILARDKINDSWAILRLDWNPTSPAAR